jgi:hypothetical protein
VLGIGSGVSPGCVGACRPDQFVPPSDVKVTVNDCGPVDVVIVTDVRARWRQARLQQHHAARHGVDTAFVALHLLSISRLDPQGGRRLPLRNA